MLPLIFCREFNECLAIGERYFMLFSNVTIKWSFCSRIMAQLAVSIVVVMAALGQAVFAQSVQPMVYQLETIGNNSSTNLTIENTKSSAITYEMVAVKVSHDEMGNETRTDAEDDFLIYPPQTLVAPGKKQIIKVKYVGDPQLELSQTYRILVNELPVDLSGGENSGISVAINFSTLCNVVPTGSSAALEVTELSQAEGDKWSITIENSGTRFSRLTETIVEVSSLNDPSKKKVFRNEYISDLFNKNLVAPKSKLKLEMPAIEGFEPGNTKITISETS